MEEEKTPRRRSVADNPAFVTLIQVARENSVIGDQLRRILTLDPFNRKSALGTFVERMRYQQAPEPFVAAIASLMDDAVAEKVLELLSDP